MLIYQNRDEKYVAQSQFLKILTLNMCFCVLLESALAHPHVDRINVKESQKKSNKLSCKAANSIAAFQPHLYAS